MEQKIKAFLSSPIEENQRLGCNLAKSVLNWSNFDIMMYVLNSCKGWIFEDRGLMLVYYTSFLGRRIIYGNLQSIDSKLVMENKTKRADSLPIKEHKEIELKMFFTHFIEQNL